MRIFFSPQRRDGALTLEKTSGDRLRVNGQLLNFNGLNDGDTIRGKDVPCEWIVGDIHRADGELHVTVILPHGPNPSPAMAFPEPVTATEDGPIAVPQREPMWTPDPSIIVTAADKAAAERRAELSPLVPYQFRAMLKIAGVEEAVTAAVAAIPDPAQRAVAEAKVEYALSFQRDDPLFEMLGPAVGLTSARIDELWRQAVAL